MSDLGIDWVEYELYDSEQMSKIFEKIVLPKLDKSDYVTIQGKQDEFKPIGGYKDE